MGGSVGFGPGPKGPLHPRKPRVDPQVCNTVAPWLKMADVLGCKRERHMDEDNGRPMLPASGFEWSLEPARLLACCCNNQRQSSCSRGP